MGPSGFGFDRLFLFHHLNIRKGPPTSLGIYSPAAPFASLLFSSILLQVSRMSSALVGWITTGATVVITVMVCITKFPFPGPKPNPPGPSPPPDDMRLALLEVEVQNQAEAIKRNFVLLQMMVKVLEQSRD